MKRAGERWMVLGIATLILAGIIGDWIFAPHPENFSFRTLSNYAAAVIMLMVGASTWIER